MSNTFLLSFFSLLLVVGNGEKVSSNAAAAEMICGKWQTKEKNLVVEVYKDNDQFKGRIVWFNDGTNDMEHLTDRKNPDPELRSRKILGMNVVEKLVYSPESNSWEDGVIYDAKSGRHWNSSAYIDKSGQLRVKGYWHMKFIGKTMTFTRI